jgi:hypothetical protein
MAMRTTSLAAPLALSLALMLPQGAIAAGGPVPPVQGSYIAVPGSPYRYAAFKAHGDTVVVRRNASAWPGVSQLRVSGHYGIPAVDYTGSKTGLSADGRTLLLAQLPGNGVPRTTRLLVLDTAPLTVRARITLSGWSTVDAISPDGRWLYLIHYPSSDISKYEVQAYDLRTLQLLAKPVIDPRDRGEAMTGFPMTRVMSADGRWAYTLYFRPSGVPFIHALDTAARRAVCIDLPSLASVDIATQRLRLGPGGATLQVRAGGLTRATIDTRTFAVSAGGVHSASAAIRPQAPARRDSRGDSDAPVGLLALSIAALIAIAAAAAGAAARKRHPAAPVDAEVRASHIHSGG